MIFRPSIELCVNSGELDPPVPGDVDPTLVVIEEQYYKERFDSNQIYLS